MKDPLTWPEALSRPDKDEWIAAGIVENGNHEANTANNHSALDGLKWPFSV